MQPCIVMNEVEVNMVRILGREYGTTHINNRSQAAKSFFWPNPASAVKVCFWWIITHQVFYEAYNNQPDIKIISLSLLRKMTKSKVKTVKYFFF